MAFPAFPRTLLRCPCADTDSHNEILRERLLSTPANTNPSDGSNSLSSDTDTLNPHDVRSNFSLFPLDHLMFCEECHEIRCQRCTIEEIVLWYCPNCLGEVSPTAVEQDGRRCMRNCFCCPLCSSHLSVQGLPSKETSEHDASFILSCNYCQWDSLDIGLQLPKSTGIYEQLRQFNQQRKTRRPRIANEKSDRTLVPLQQHEDQFKNLQKFYTEQLIGAGYDDPFSSGTPSKRLDSPNLARLVNRYASGKVGSQMAKLKPSNGEVREARTLNEGVREIDLEEEDDELAAFLAADDSLITTNAQRIGRESETLWTTDLTPQAMLLRTKRSRRCRMCRHILVRPEAKAASLRYRIRLLANKYCPAISLEPLLAPPEPDTSPTPLDLTAIPPHKPIQFLLTFRNPMFSKVKVTLATPRETPGLLAHTVTLLCPQFELGSNTDVWDEALSGAAPVSTSIDSRLSKVKLDDGRVAEAGKVWSSERNSTTVVIEIVCTDRPRDHNKKEKQEVRDQYQELQIPIYMRMEYEIEVGKEEEKKKKERREMAYWIVLEVGRVAVSTES